jgi:hypothetical protein
VLVGKLRFENFHIFFFRWTSFSLSKNECCVTFFEVVRVVSERQPAHFKWFAVDFVPTVRVEFKFVRSRHARCCEVRQQKQHLLLSFPHSTLSAVTMDYTSGGTPVAGFIFPVLKASEIQQCMSELGTELNVDELQDPSHHKEKLRKVFLFLVR